MTRRFVRFLADSGHGLEISSRLLSGCLVLLFIGSVGLAQKSTGDILGTVTDASGSVVPGVKITLTNEETQDKRDTTTNAVGEYRFPFVPIGTYSLKAEREGFKAVIVNQLILHVNDFRRQDFTLQVGEASQSVAVTATVESVNAENPTLGGLVDTKRMEELPLNGRAFLTLATLVAGSVDTSAFGAEDNAQGYIGQGRPGQSASVSGVRSVDTLILFDGISNKNQYQNNIGIQPTPDSIAEFKVLTGYITPEFGAPSAVNVVTKSGTNDFHGAAWEFLRNDKLDARNTFEPEVAKLRQNQFGGAGGGRIIKNKLFFFGDYERLERRGASRSVFAIVPDPAFFSGDFSSIPTPIIDPLTKQPFPNNQIPADRISSFAKAAQQFWPAATPNAPAPYNFLGTGRSTQTDEKWSVRVDWNVSEKDKIFGRFSYMNSELANIGAFPYSGSETPVHSRNVSVNWTHIFSPRMVNVARFGLDHVFVAAGSPYNSAGNPDFGALLGLENLKSPAACNSLTSVSVQGVNGFGGATSCEVPTNNNPIYSDNLSYQVGRHYITLGGELIQFRENDIVSFDANGNLSFNGQFSGNGVADFILGYPNHAGGGQWQGPMNRRAWWPSLYINDEFKVRPNFTLDYGIRWQYTQPPIEVDDKMGMIDFANGGKLLLAGRNGVSRGLRTPHKKDFAPRVGFAWSPGGNQSWALRSSYGIFFARMPGNEYVWQGITYPWNLGFAYASEVQTPTINIDNLFPTIPIDYNNPNPPPGSFMFNLEDGKNPYLQQWTLSVEHTLPGDIFVQAAYVGSKGTNLSKRFNQNIAPLPALDDPRPLSERLPYPQFFFILNDKNVANSWYHGLQLTARKTYGHGLTGQASYTWSHCLDEDSYDGKATRNYRLDDLDKGRCIQDFRQRFVLSMVYDLPFGQHMTGVARQVVGGWRVNAIVGLQTGGQFTIYAADLSDTGQIFSTRPNVTCNPSLPAGDRNRDRWFDTSCFATAPFRTYGDAPSNWMDGPPLHSIDLSLGKVFRLTESKSLEFRAEAFNFPNLTNLGQPDNYFYEGSPTFGTISAAKDGRQIQFGLKFIF